MKYFIINYGPPASGKGSLKLLIVRSLGIDEKTISDIDVDKIVVYVCKNNRIECDNISQDDYKKYRKDADEMSDAQLKESLEKGLNIIWETTGNSIDWTINTYIPLVKSHGYQIVLSLPIVKLNKIIKRCSMRKQAANCTYKYLNEVRNNSYTNFKTLSKYCDVVMIYDNNAKAKLIYNNQCVSNVSPRSFDKTIASSKILSFLNSKKCIKKRKRSRHRSKTFKKF